MTPPDDHDPEELDIEVRPADDIAGRLVILAAVVRRASAELPADDEDDDEDEDAAPVDSPEGQQFDVLLAVNEEPLLASTITPAERRLLAAPIGSLGQDGALAATWQLEALAAIAALCLRDRFENGPWELADPAGTLAGIP